jgi:hypothetical protein
MTRYFESAAARNEEDAVARVLESGAVAGGGGLNITETWTGTDGTPWPTPKWSVTNPTEHTVTNTIQGNRGRLTAGAAPYALALAVLTESTHTDVEVRYTYNVDNATAESYVDCMYRLDHTGTIGGYPGFPVSCYGVDFQPNNNVVYLVKVDSGGTGENLATVNSAGINVTSDINVHLLVVGNNHKVRWWIGGTEPSTWQIDYTDVGTPYTSGKFGFADYNGDYTGTRQFEYDNLTVAAPAAPVTLLKGVGSVSRDNLPAELALVGASWFYDWANYSDTDGIPPVPSTPGVEYVPMMWGDWVNEARYDIGGPPSESTGPSTTLLGFNEPNIADQSAMTPARARALWPQLEATGLRLGSPAVSPDLGSAPEAWLDTFVANTSGYQPRVDFICAHWYTEYDGGYPNIGDYLDYLHTRYGKPIWITEVGTLTGGQAANAALMPTVMSALATRPWVERIAWFVLQPTEWTGTELINVGPPPTLTAAGTQYATYPAGTIPPGPEPLGARSDGTSTATGTLSTGKQLIAASAGTSTVTSALGVTRGLTGVTSAGAGTTTSALGVARPLAGSSAGTSTATAAAGAVVAMTASSAGTSTVTASTLALPRALAGASAGTSAVTPALTVAIPLVSASAGLSTVTALLGLTKNMAAAADGVSTTTAALQADHLMVGTSGGTSTAGATMAVASVQALASSSAGVATVTGALSITSANAFAGASNGVSTATAALGVVHTLAASAAGSASTTSALANTVAMAATSGGTSTVSAPGMVAVRGLAGSSAGVATVTSSGSQVAHSLIASAAGVATVPTANLSTTAAGGLGGIVSGTSTATGALSVAMSLAGAAAGTSAVVADLARTIQLAAAAAGTSTVSGNFVRALPLIASSAGASTVLADLSKVHPLAASSAGTSTVVAGIDVAKLLALAGSSAGTSTVTATGVRVVLGLAAASGGLSNAVAVIVVAYKLAALSNGRATAAGELTTFRVTGVYGMWNGHIFDDMYYGDKKVIDWMMVPS